MTEQVAENYPVREILPDKEMVEISDVPQIIQWPNGSTPEPIIHRVILRGTRGQYSI